MSFRAPPTVLPGHPLTNSPCPCLSYLHLTWSATFQIVVVLSLLFWLLGPAVFAGIGVIVVLAPINWVIGKMQNDGEEKLLAKKDERLKITTELLQVRTHDTTNTHTHTHRHKHMLVCSELTQCAPGHSPR